MLRDVSEVTFCDREQGDAAGLLARVGAGAPGGDAEPFPRCLVLAEMGSVSHGRCTAVRLFFLKGSHIDVGASTG